MSRVFPAMTMLLVCWLALADMTTQAIAAEPSSLCDAAAQQAARRSNVPLALMRAIARVETGRGDTGRGDTGRGDPVRPWPWTVNSAGKGHWFASRHAALDFAKSELAAGRDRFDLGCFQINRHWHGDKFLSLEDMIDPMRNAEEAARYLAELYAAHGSWSAAAAAYHSRDPERARRYLLRVAEAVIEPPAIRHAPTRRNHYPLLIAATAPNHTDTGDRLATKSSRSHGSLVPLTPARMRLIGAD